MHIGITGTTRTFLGRPYTVYPPPTLNTSITFNNKIATTPKYIADCFTRQTGPLTVQHIKYKDITSHSPQLRSNRQ